MIASSLPRSFFLCRIEDSSFSLVRRAFAHIPVFFSQLLIPSVSCILFGISRKFSPSLGRLSRSNASLAMMFRTDSF